MYYCLEKKNKVEESKKKFLIFGVTSYVFRKPKLSISPIFVDPTRFKTVNILLPTVTEKEFN